MVYVEYEEYKAKYYDAQKECDSILSEKEKFFIRTQPKATDISKELVSGGVPVNAFDIYVEKISDLKINERLEEARSILEDRGKLLKLKETELRLSKDWLDIIYAYYFIDKLSIRKIERKIPFSKSEIYRKLNEIKASLGQKGKKSMVK